MTAVRRGRKGRSLSVTPRGWRCRWGMGEAAIWRRTRPLWKRQTWRGERCSTWCTTVAGTSGKTGLGEKSPNVYIHPKKNKKKKKKTSLNLRFSLRDHRYMGIPYRYIPSSQFCFTCSSPMVSTLIMENTGPSSGRNRTEYWVDVDHFLSFPHSVLSNPLSVCPPAVCLSAKRTDRLEFEPILPNQWFWWNSFSFIYELPLWICERPTKVLLHSPLPLNPLPPPQRVRVNAVLSRVLGYHNTEVN